ncbi:MAG: hypothetical protein C4321_10175 [Chloroflexota bacterium]
MAKVTAGSAQGDLGGRFPVEPDLPLIHPERVYESPGLGGGGGELGNERVGETRSRTVILDRDTSEPASHSCSTERLYVQTGDMCGFWATAFLKNLAQPYRRERLGVARG